MGTKAAPAPVAAPAGVDLHETITTVAGLGAAAGTALAPMGGKVGATGSIIAAISMAVLGVFTNRKKRSK